MFNTIFQALAVPIAMIGAVFMMTFMLSVLNLDIRPIIAITIALTPIWLPLALFFITFEQWMYAVQLKFEYETGRTTLRIKPPQEVFKSPEAMESILSQMFNANSPDNLMQTYLDGKHAITSSLEIVSHGGEVRFYANVPSKKVKNQLESQLYAQYPGIEVTEELIDYTAEVKDDPNEWDTFTFHLAKKDENDVLPIKTYIDFGMDKLPKEEQKVEPMAPLIEHISRTKPHERIWVQILITPHLKKEFKNGSLSKVGTWEAKAKKTIDAMMGRDKKSGVEETESRPILTAGEKDTIAAIERNVSKPAYETAVRTMYIAKAGTFDGEMIGHMLSGFSQFDMIGRNAIGPRWRTDFDYKFFQDRSGLRLKAIKSRELEYYKSRYYTEADKRTKVDRAKVMSVEELATIYHMPGTSVVTPGLNRVENTRREAPANLPVGDFAT